MDNEKKIRMNVYCVLQIFSQCLPLLIFFNVIISASGISPLIDNAFELHHRSLSDLFLFITIVVWTFGCFCYCGRISLSMNVCLNTISNQIWSCYRVIPDL